MGPEEPGDRASHAWESGESKARWVRGQTLQSGPGRETWKGSRSASTGKLLLLSSPENLFQEKENLLLDSKDAGLWGHRNSITGSKDWLSHSVRDKARAAWPAEDSAQPDQPLFGGHSGLMVTSRNTGSGGLWWPEATSRDGKRNRVNPWTWSLLAFLGCPEILEAGACSRTEVDRGLRGFESPSLKNLLLSSNPEFAQVAGRGMEGGRVISFDLVELKFKTAEELSCSVSFCLHWPGMCEHQTQFGQDTQHLTRRCDDSHQFPGNLETTPWDSQQESDVDCADFIHSTSVCWVPSKCHTSC